MNKVRNALFSIKDFLKNLLVPIKFKELVLKSVVISKVSYIASYWVQIKSTLIIS